MSDAPEQPPAFQPVGRIIAMPADTNPEGDIFGGWLLAHMDLAGATPAFELACGRCATVALDSMVFHQPVSSATRSAFTPMSSVRAAPRSASMSRPGSARGASPRPPRRA